MTKQLSPYCAAASLEIQQAISQTTLVAKNALTRWQADQLLLGRYKGFFVDRYKLVDHVGDTNLRIRYLAEDLQTKKMLVLAMMPKQYQRGPHPQYLVEEQ